MRIYHLWIYMGNICYFVLYRLYLATLIHIKSLCCLKLKATFIDLVQVSIVRVYPFMVFFCFSLKIELTNYSGIKRSLIEMKTVVYIIIWKNDTGLVLYWFGHAPYARLDNGHGDVYVKGWEVPKEFMMPTGDIARVGGWTNTWLMDDGWSLRF